MISASLLYQAAFYYQSKGFMPCSVPLVVDEGVSSATRPHGRRDLPHTHGKVYSASAEQSFMQQMKDQYPFTPGSRLQALTPCYRDEPVLDETHYRIFLKIELLELGDSPEYVLSTAESWFRSLGLQVERVQEEGQTDLVCEGLELGSYGVRSFHGITYVYGTGFAEPRTSVALARFAAYR